jgi:hypothetical protein
MVSQSFSLLPGFAQTVAPEDPTQIAPSATSPALTLDTLSFEAQDTAKRLELWSALVQFDAMRRQKLAGKQVGADYIEARQTLMESVMIVSQDVRTFVHFVEEEVAKADAIYAMIAARRDKALKLNTYGDLIAGGISGMIGGGLAIADVNHISYDTIDAAEGLAQAGLAYLSLREQRGEKRIQKGLPNLLARLFEPEKGPSPAYPACVWKFLNSPSSQNPASQTRREKLVADWTKSGFCVSHHGTHRSREAALSERRARITNNSQKNYRITAGLIEDRSAMLHELRSTVTRLDVIMLEILLYMRGNSLASSAPTS